MNPRRADFDRFVADSSDTLLRAAYLIVWDLGEAEDLVRRLVAKRGPAQSRSADDAGGGVDPDIQPAVGLQHQQGVLGR